MEYIPLAINVSNFIDSYRNIGYTVETAIADIIDNSIFAKATELHVDMELYDSYWKEPTIKIIDNGHGMKNEELIEAMRLACRSPLEVRDSADLGRYGLGLKSASFSQCKVVTVISKVGDEISCKQWDLDHVKEVNKFEINNLQIEAEYANQIIPFPSGTAVIWSKIDGLTCLSVGDNIKKEKEWNHKMLGVYHHIAITYKDFDDSIFFFFNDNKIEMWDPFLVSNPNTVIIAEEGTYLGDTYIPIKSYILPNKLSPKEQDEASFNSSMNDLQGFYIYRNKRLIKYGTWLGLPKLVKKEAYRLARIRIDIDNSMDALWSIDIKKETAICPASLTDTLLSYAKKAQTESMKVFRSKGKTLRRKGTDSSKNLFFWEQKMYNGKPCYYINKNHPLISDFEESLDTEQKGVFKTLIKCFEGYIPVMSILQTESTQNGKYIDNMYENLTIEELKTCFDSSVKNLINTQNINYEEAVNVCLAIEPFITYQEQISKLIEEEL